MAEDCAPAVIPASGEINAGQIMSVRDELL
jgi:hypothetical protein